ncbi:TonB-dependent receptor [Chromatocurvus halotolerans]|uniref:Iron complex outermembrane receptor protein n=1 Tax=Chromatocurvus halotolerans TaxID=1132028 RepID=A0A4R2KTX7_9GAMM|nr:TonB-dependent receptor [Chromatocurvus halotolerans]TCO77851.1 iron complex outermembrane receptor protein [Chromatocurvus halotolerans]
MRLQSILNDRTKRRERERPFKNRHRSPVLVILIVLAAKSGILLAQSGPQALEEVIVTAQKQEQSLQDVTLSIDVLRGRELAMIRASAQDVLFLAARSPSVYAESSSGRTFPRFYIRGLGNTDFDLNAGQPVSLVYDDVVLENSILKGFPVFDTDRIEIVRGPQGTLYGRNTPAGVIRFESAKPSSDREGYLRGAFGRFNTVDIEGAFNAPLDSEVISIRASGLYQRRDDFVDNRFPGGEDGFEEFEEYAARVQVLYQPAHNFSALLNIHGRQLDGGSRLFRANIIEPGTDDLVNDFRLTETAQDATQILEVDNFGTSLKLDWQLPVGTLTSISAYETVRANARGDVDGGFGADFAPPVGPGSIPFSAETADNITGHKQITQELRLATSVSRDVGATLGVFVFYENLEIENLSFDTLSDGLLNGLAIQDQETQAWAIFASTRWQITQPLEINAGLRLSGEEKELVASRLVAPFGAPALGPVRRDIDDTVLSGDMSVRYALTKQHSIYGRYARSFRAPNLQGRIVFGDSVTVAGTEIIDSVEFGLRSEFIGGRARLNATTFYFRTDDQQLTAVGGAGNFNQLLNADSVNGYGVEIDLSMQLIEGILLQAGYSLNHTEIEDPGLEVAVCAVECTILDPVNPETGNALIDGNSLPQAPEHIANASLLYEALLPGDWGKMSLSGDVSYRSRVNFFLYDSVEFRGDDETVVGVRAAFVPSGTTYEFAIFGRNIFDDRSVKGGIDFNNFSGFVSEPRTWGVEARVMF